MNPRNRYALTALAVGLVWGALYIATAIHRVDDPNQREWILVCGGLLGIGNYVSAALLRNWLARVTWAQALLATPVHVWCIFTGFIGPIYLIGFLHALALRLWSQVIDQFSVAIDSYLTTLLQFVASDSMWLIAPISAASVEVLWFAARTSRGRPSAMVKVASIETKSRIQ